jgi:hypothetical protein
MVVRLFLIAIILTAALTGCTEQPVTFVEPSVRAKETPPPLFDGWKKPKVLLFFTGFLEGYIEPCGCAGIDKMKGGLGRRYTCLQELEKQGWDVLPIDAGNLNKGFGQQEELKFGFVIDEAYRRMNYQAVGIGDRELLLPTDTLINYFLDAPSVSKRYTSANVALFNFDPETVKPYRVLEKNGMKIGVVSGLGGWLLKELHNDEIAVAPAAEKLPIVLPKLAAEKCDRTVLIIHGTTNEINLLLEKFADKFDFILPSNTPAEPPPKPKTIGKTMLLEVGEKGRYAIAIGLFDDPAMPIRYERIPMDARYDNSPIITGLMQMYQNQLKDAGLAGLGIHPIPHTREGNFLGAQSCSDCHETAMSVWRKSNHSKAWQSLTEKAKPARDFDPECIACHVVGWNAAELLPYKGGFLSEKETPRLTSVSCDACHGPGEEHVRVEAGSNQQLQENVRKTIRLPVAADTAKKHCLTCHDGNNSPNFDFETYWKKIEHKPKD